MLSSGIRISEATLRVVREALKASVSGHGSGAGRTPEEFFKRTVGLGRDLFFVPTRPNRPGIPVLLVRLDLDVVPHVTDPNAVLQRTMAGLSAAGELAIGFAAGTDCPVAAVFLHQVFDMGYGAHSFHLSSEHAYITKLPFQSMRLIKIKR